MRRAWVKAAAVLACCALPAAAQDVIGFRSPSGNIHCQFFVGDHDPTIRCDLAQISNRPPPRPRDCPLEWGQAFEISARAVRGERLCYGDTVQDARLPVLPYGEGFARGGIVCTSAQTGVTCRNPAGAFYVFPNITGTGMTSREFADRLLDDFGVAALSGTSFGEHGEGYLRLSYANSEENLAKALERIDAAARQLVAAR